MTDELTVTSIEDANIDIKAASDTLFLGPQAELVEQIANFNNYYNRYYNSHATKGDVIQINKNYGFKPGVYDKIKEVHANYCLGYRSKPSDMWSLKYRIDNGRYKDRNFWRDAIAIQANMRRLKANNVGWQDNVVVVEQFFDELRERIPNEIERALNVFTDDSITVGIQESNQSSENPWNNLRIIIELFTSDIDMQVFHQEDEIANYKWGNVATRWSIPFWKFVNNWCDGGTNSRYNSSISNPQAKLYPKYPHMYHPYVSANSYYSADNQGWLGHTCTGDMQSNLKEATWALDIEALCSLTRSWLSRYHIPRTNPLNRIENCLYGWEIGMDKRIWSHRGQGENTTMANCRWPNVFTDLVNYDGDNPCDTCQFESGYAYLLAAAEIPEDSEYPGQRVVVVEPCSNAIRPYQSPITEEDTIAEACVLHLLCCRELRSSRMRTLMDDTALDVISSNTNPFPTDANLELICDYNEDFDLDNAFKVEHRAFVNSNVEDYLDTVFHTNIYHNLVDEYIELMGYCEDEADDIAYDLRQESIESIRTMISNEHQRQEGTFDSTENNRWDPLAIANLPHDANMTPEELTIRWATERGRTINI